MSPNYTEATKRENSRPRSPFLNPIIKLVLNWPWPWKSYQHFWSEEATYAGMNLASKCLSACKGAALLVWFWGPSCQIFRRESHWSDALPHFLMSRVHDGLILAAMATGGPGILRSYLHGSFLWHQSCFFIAQPSKTTTLTANNTTCSSITELPFSFHSFWAVSMSSDKFPRS